ncbi:type III effector protein [Yinghuangia sp. YIM S09857]|uniref:type III effector protein n=1 Tax=Yinghuangia sp. YIM S09857 TaxID=3436929 RepID=UPI003F53276D
MPEPKPDRQPAPPRDRPVPQPVPFFAAAAALAAIDDAVGTAQEPSGADRPGARPRTPDADEVLAALLLLREVRGRLAAWEPDLIETARHAGASWASLAGPLGVTSRQAAERRYLRLRPGGAAGSTGDQRVQATRDRRAADRAVTAWARAHAADLRSLAGAVTATGDLGRAAGPPLAALADALGHNDPARLIGPLADLGPHLAPAHHELAARVHDLADRVDAVRNASDHGRNG